MSQLPKCIDISEEGPREGFQFEKGPIATTDKIRLIDSLSQTGLKEIQIASFVNPRRVPGMADVEQVVSGITRNPAVSYTGLWLNERGLERAVATRGLDIRGYLLFCASEPFLLRNQRRTIRENLEVQRNFLTFYRTHDIPIESAQFMAAFGCNFKGDVSVAELLGVVDEAMQFITGEGVTSVQTISLADTMAWATPASIRRVVGAVRDRYPEMDISLHLHDTRGMGIANAYAGLEMGVSHFDSSVAGLGGCPFAGHAGAAGNVCTEDLVFMCEEMGIETGVNLDALIESARLAEEVVGHSLPGAVMRGGSLKARRRALAS